MAGLAATFGSGAMTNSIGEIPDCELMFIIGSNPSEAHPVIGAKMRQALQRGAGLIVADPRKIDFAHKADVWLQLKPGTDIALVNGLMHIILKQGWENRSFIESCTDGIEQVAAAVAAYTPEKVTAITGVPGELLYRAAELYAKAERAAIFYTLGITEHVTGTDNVMTLANLAMLTGNIGKPSAGVNPLRGQNNVQGACDAGALPDVFTGYQKVRSAEAREKFEKAWNCKLSDIPGMTIPEMFDAAAMGKLKAMYIMGENPVLSDANAAHVIHAIKKLDFLVVQDLFMTETAKLADVVLPAASFAEKEGTFTNTERRIQRVRQAIPPIGQSRPDGNIIMELAGRMGHFMHYGQPRDVMAEIAQVSPIYAGVTYERIERQGLQWPVLSSEHPGTVYLHDSGRFACGKGKFTPTHYQPPAETTDDDYPLLLTTGRILQHYNVSTSPFSRTLSAYRPQERVMVNPADAAAYEIREGELIEVVSRRGRVTAAAWITGKVPAGVIWMSFHFPDSPTNRLTNDAADKVTNTYEYKVCAARIKKL